MGQNEHRLQHNKIENIKICMKTSGVLMKEHIANLTLACIFSDINVIC